MKNLFLASFFLMLSASLFSQVGISGVYSTINHSGWDDVMDGEGVNGYDNGVVYGLDYWFRLEEFRVEFLPELSYGQFDNLIEDPSLTSLTIQSELDIYAFSFNTHIYIFDIEGDCNCPTWGKEGGVFNKGFFLMAGPGVAHFKHDDIIFRQPTENPVIMDSSSTRFTFAAGMGLDIGITKALTITPFGRFKWYSAGTWDALEVLATTNGNQDNYQDYDSSLNQLQGGIRLSYRWGQ